MTDIVVAIVTYKCAALTIDCLRSIAAERTRTGLPLRAVVVDNTSGDAPAVRRAVDDNSWPWVDVVEAPRNGGFAYGNNLAIQRAYQAGPPDYIHFLNPDTVVLEGAIRELVDFLEAHADVGVAGSKLEDSNGVAWSFAFRFPSILGELEAGLQFGLATRILKGRTVRIEEGPVPQITDWVSGASMMVRRALIDAMGGFDENYFLYFEETDFCYRAKQAGFSTWYVPQSRVIHFTGQSTQVGTDEARPKRLPACWFESRRRYFTATYGLRYAMAADVVALMANGLGTLKRALQRRRGIPHYLSDLAHHSSVWSRARDLAPVKSFKPVTTSPPT